MSLSDMPPLEDGITPERVRALRLQIFQDMELLAGAIFVPEDDADRDAVLSVAESIHHLTEAFLELR